MAGRREGEEESEWAKARQPDVAHVPVVYVPHIGERDDTLLHQIPQILDRRTGATAAARARTNRRKERASRLGVQTLSVPLARHGRRCRRSRRNGRGGRCSYDWGCA